MSKVWVTSDWHFGHNKDFLFGSRGFANIEEMSKQIIKNYNEVVSYNDDIFFLGDAMLNDNDFGMSCIRQLKGNIHMILGNHDTAVRENLYADLYNVVEVCYARPLRYKGYNFWLSHYPSLCGNHDEDKPLNRRVISLCGHTHTEDKWIDWNKGLIYHCEVDAHNLYPVEIDQILEDIKRHI